MGPHSSKNVGTLKIARKPVVDAGTLVEVVVVWT